MLLSVQKISGLNSGLAAHFFQTFHAAPWTISALGKLRAVTPNKIDDALRWAAQLQTQQANIFATLPQIEGRHWFLAVTAPAETRTSELDLLPTHVILAGNLTLLWRLQEPQLAADALRMSELLAKQMRGARAVTDGLVPLPGTVAFVKHGVQLTGRHIVQMLEPLAVAYRVADGAIQAPRRKEAAPLPALTACADGIHATAVKWVWPGYIPLGALSIISGAEGMGKSQVAINIAATVSSGGTWPDGSRAQQGGALVFEAEDDAGSVIKPRLIAAGADLRRVGIGGGFDLSEGVGALVAETKRIGGVRLVVLSPLRTFFKAAEDHGNSGVRAALKPLLEWAATSGVSIVGITHPPSAKKYTQAFAGSQGYVEVARAAFSVLPDPDDDNPLIRLRRRVLVAAKANLAPDGEIMGFRIEGVEAGGIATSRVVWEPRLPADVDEKPKAKTRRRSNGND